MIALITGVGGLIGSEAARFFHKKGFTIIGIDNDLRKYFFGETSSTKPNLARLKEEIKNLENYDVDIRDVDKLATLFKKYGKEISVIIHTAAQPSHDWAAKEPFTDFTVNANGTLNLLEMTRQYCSDAVFIFTSTNKVYGDTPNYLPLNELNSRFEISESHQYFEHGIDESMSIDNTKHSLFGASKVAADVLVQEYGKYFGMKTAVFRGGCLTGPNHAGAPLHGFLSYLVKCAVTQTPYTILGYKGKQVRDNIHSYDLVNAFWSFYQKPRSGEIYNIGGGRYSNCSILEAISIIESKTHQKVLYSMSTENRIGDHIWWISDCNKFKSHFPEWNHQYGIDRIIGDIIDFTKSESSKLN
jgi:CDP-paratose 2-epimerase